MGGDGKGSGDPIPEEIDEHYRLFGKEPWEVDYGEKCAVCGSPVDECGLCACDSASD